MEKKNYAQMGKELEKLKKRLFAEREHCKELESVVNSLRIELNCSKAECKRQDQFNTQLIDMFISATKAFISSEQRNDKLTEQIQNS